MDAESAAGGRSTKPATAARIYDYYLGGTHHFDADRETAQKVLAVMPTAPLMARANRAFLGRAVRHLAEAGVRQFLDLGSGMPTEGNVHQIAQLVDPGSRVVYVDMDPVAVSESLELLNGDVHATAIQGDMREPEAILTHPQVTKLLDFNAPIALVLCAVLHFVPDDDQAYGLVSRLREPLVPGSYLVISHGASEGGVATVGTAAHPAIQEAYSQRTASSAGGRTYAGVQRFFTGTDLVEPGIVWVPEWRPDPDEHNDFADDPRLSCVWAGIGRLH